MAKVNVPRARPRSRPVGRPSAQEGRDTRADLLRVARELFAARGFAGTSVSEVAAQADVTIPVIYQRFGNKAGLFVAVAEDVYGYGVVQLRRAVRGAKTFDDAVDAAMAEFATLYEIDPSLGAVVVTVLVEAGRDHELGQALHPAMREFRRFVDDIAKLAPIELAADAAERRVLARALVALFSGIMISAPNLSKPGDYKDMVNGMRKMIRRSSG